MANLYVIGGCNGAGKTTASFTVLPEMLNCKEFVNADEIAKGLSPFQPDKVAFESGRIMLQRIDELLNQQADFGFESTLATKSYRKTIEEAQQSGYFVTLIYFWLNSVELAIERVNRRVAAGGHNIPEEIIRRRYTSGIKNLINLFIPVADYWMIIDNSKNPFTVIGEGFKSDAKEIYHLENWQQINRIANG
jgi:predicted ABC-type ATPase